MYYSDFTFNDESIVVTLFNVVFLETFNDELIVYRNLVFESSIILATFKIKDLDSMSTVGHFLTFDIEGHAAQFRGYRIVPHPSSR